MHYLSVAGLGEIVTMACACITGRAKEARERKARLTFGAITGFLVLCFWVVVGTLAVYATRIEPNRPEVVEVSVSVHGLPAAWDGLRIAHISDLHMMETGERERMVAWWLDELEPDLIVITGDFIPHTVLLDVHRAWIETVAEWIGSLNRPPLGIWASRGNTDISRYGEFSTALMDILDEAGIHFLLNRAEPLERDGERIWLAGADFAKFSTGFASDFAVVGDGDNRWLAAGRSDGNSLSHFWPQEALRWHDYEFSGRFMRQDEKGGIGVTFYSQVPAGREHYYRLRSYAKQPSLQIAPRGVEITGGITDTHIIPEPGQWYRFRIQVESAPAKTLIRARVWADGTPEPAEWQIDCYDDSETRLQAGTVGVWGLDAGRKGFDDILVRGRADDMLLLYEDFEAVEIGERPIDWLAYGSNRGNVHLALRDVPADEIAIMLVHSPDQAPEAASLGADLVLAGHTHGGQIRLPFIGALYTGTHLGPAYAAGLFHVDGVPLYVTRGIGTNGWPVRFLCAPEVTLISLRAAQE